jgi:hypothetical protein
VTQQDIDLLMLGMDDGQYANVAGLIADKVVSMFKEKKLRESFSLSVLEKMATVLSANVKVTKIFKSIREIYSLKGATAKIRSCFER